MQAIQIPTSIERFPSHKKIAERAIGELARDDRVLGLYLSGSFACGEPDVYSDLDLNILVRGEQREQIIKDHCALISSVGKVGTVFPATHLGDSNQIIVFYEEEIPIHVDYQYRSQEELVPGHHGQNTFLIFDNSKDIGKWKRACGRVREDNPPLVDRIQYFEDRFWGWTWYTYCKIARGELWEARSAEEYLRENVIVKLLYHRLSLPDEGCRRLEDKTPCEYLLLLEGTIANKHSRDSYMSSLMSLISMYSRLVTEITGDYSLDGLNRVDRNYFINAIASDFGI